MRKSKIKILSCGVAWPGQYLRMMKTHYLDRNGNPGHWEFISRKGVVFIFPITPDGIVVLIRQYRIPQNSFVIEMPAGVCDKDGESKEETARRELREETGYAADKLIEVRPIRAASAAISGEVNIFLGLNARRVGEPSFDESEDIEILEVPFKELLTFLMSQPPKIIIDSNVIAVWSMVKELRLVGKKNA